MSNEPLGKLRLCIEPLLAGSNDTSTAATGRKVVALFADPKMSSQGLRGIIWFLTEFPANPAFLKEEKVMLLLKIVPIKVKKPYLIKKQYFSWLFNLCYYFLNSKLWDCFIWLN